MRTTIPSDTNRTYTLIIGLDMAGMAFVSGGFFGGFGLMHFSWPLGLKLPVAMIIAGIGAALGWGRWPLSDTGDRIGVWMLRFVHYFLDEMVAKRYLPPPPPTPKRRRKSGRPAPSQER